MWDLIKELTALAHLAVRDAAGARFDKNLGTSQCDHCDGLKAGPDVVATCFQTKLCYYTNVKADETTPKHQRTIDALLGG